MNKRTKVRTILCVLLAVTVLTAFAAMAAGGAGSQTDPLVTLSYLRDTFTGQVMDKVDALLAQQDAALRKELGDKLAQMPAGTAGGTYSAVTLSAGQTLRGEAGCEVLLRSGSARCTGETASGLADATTGGMLAAGGPLEANHLYLLPDSGGVTAGEDAVLLARGTYTIE